MKDSSVALGEGRRLAYTELGDPHGPCVLFFHGAPASRMQLLVLDAELARQGVRVVSPDRPGYGRSSPRPGRALADWPADVAALADALAIDRFAVAGHSSGGPYAVACAAALPDRVSAALVLAGVTDMGWPGAWPGFLETEAMLMRLGDGPAILAWCAEHFGADGSRFFEEAGFELTEPDAAWLASQDQAALAADSAEAFRQGFAGYVQDVVAQRRPWFFDPARITTRVDVVQGEQDAIVPLAHGRHIAASIPGSRLRTFPEHGHLSILSELPALVAALASRCAR